VSTASTENTAGTRKPRPVVRSGPLGARIVTAAAELLDESGNEAAVTLRAIARRAGVSAPAIYGHYPDVPSIFLVVVQDAFAELGEALRAAAGLPPSADQDAQQMAVRRLRAVCAAYLDFAARRPQRYRIMFGGLWTATRAIESSTVSHRDVEALGQDALAVFVTAVQGCVQTGASSSDDSFADAVGLWLALHGLADQRGVTAAFPWPADIEQRVVTAQAHLTVH
jgi:AcrR family transcriptional regulator